MGFCHLDRRGQPTRMMGASLDSTDRREHEARLHHVLAEARRLQAQIQRENIYLQQEIKAGQLGLKPTTLESRMARLGLRRHPSNN